MANLSLVVPTAWEQLQTSALHGVLLVIGGPDTGKTTFVRYLYRRLRAGPSPIAYVDGDPGQSSLGPPSTMTLALGQGGDDIFPPKAQVWRRFVGAVSPRGHMLPLLVAAARLVQTAREAGAKTVVYDTTGLIDPLQGGTALKMAKIDLLRPSTIFAMQHESELEPLLQPLRRSRRARLVELRPSSAVRRRAVAERQAHRAERFASYFSGARTLTMSWPRLAVIPAPSFTTHQLVSLEDAEGFVLGLGIIRRADYHSRQVTLRTPLGSLDDVDALRLGDLLVDPDTYRDSPIPMR